MTIDGITAVHAAYERAGFVWALCHETLVRAGDRRINRHSEVTCGNCARVRHLPRPCDGA